MWILTSAQIRQQRVVTKERVSTPLPGRWWTCRMLSGFRYDLATHGIVVSLLLGDPLHLICSVSR
jgi:hypothetical protein